MMAVGGRNTACFRNGGVTMKWEIMKGGFSEPIIVTADSFDEALEKAREIDGEYVSGRVVNSLY